jgi:hypothetical protein
MLMGCNRCRNANNANRTMNTANASVTANANVTVNVNANANITANQHQQSERATKQQRNGDDPAPASSLVSNCSQGGSWVLQTTVRMTRGVGTVGQWKWDNEESLAGKHPLP